MELLLLLEMGMSACARLQAALQNSPVPTEGTQ